MEGHSLVHTSEMISNSAPPLLRILALIIGLVVIIFGVSNYDRIKRRAILFLYDTPNMLGCLWGAVGLTAFFFGVIKDYWLLIVSGLYGIGYLIAPKTGALSMPELNFTGNTLSTKDLKRNLDALTDKISAGLSQAEMETVRHIKENIESLLPRLHEIQSTDHDLHIIKQTVLDYLPHLLMTYIQLPPLFAKMHKLSNGKTSQENLVEQLTILDDQINQIVINVNSQDAQALIVQGEFLRNKFPLDKQWI